jgi:hypothetical protein
MQKLGSLNGDSRLANQIRKRVFQEKFTIDNKIELSLDEISYGSTVSQRDYCYDLVLTSREIIGFARGGFTREDLLSFYLLIKLADNTTFEIFSYELSPTIVEIHHNGVLLGRMERNCKMKTNDLNRIKKWNLYLGEKLWGEIERPIIVGRTNLVIKRVLSNVAPLIITLHKEGGLKAFWQAMTTVFLFPLTLLIKFPNTDFVLAGARGEELDLDSKRFFFCICIFMRVLVYQLEYQTDS